MLKVYLFNTPRFEYQEVFVEIPRRKSVALVAYLAVTQQPQSRDIVSNLLWPELSQENARGALRSAMYSLTKLFSDECFIATRNTITLNKSHVWVDAQAFLALLAQRRLHQHDLDAMCPECVLLAKQAINLYQGDFLSGFTLGDSVDYYDWQDFQQEFLRRQCSDVLRQMAEYCGDPSRGTFDLALEYAQRWLQLDTLHEPAHRLLMRLFAASGQYAKAIQQYEICLSLLDDKLATIPEAETVALYEEIRTKPRFNSVQSLSVQTTGILPPLPSLVIGRESALNDLKHRLGINESEKPHPITVVQGWPGVGKSTLIAALAHDHEVNHTFLDGILWASLGENPDLVAELLSWVKALKFADVSDRVSLEELTAMLRTNLRAKRMLLIVDDVWRAEHLAPFRVGGQHCALLVTSRLNDVARTIAATSRDLYKLHILTEENAFELLAALAPQAATQYPTESLALVRSLEGLPLGIQVAGRLLENEMQFDWGVKDLLVELQEGVRLLQAQAPGDLAGQLPQTPPTVGVLLQRSTDALDELTRERFADLGLFVPKPATFNLDAMAALWDVANPKETARILVNRGLLEPLSGGRFQMHALLMLHARSLQQQA